MIALLTFLLSTSSSFAFPLKDSGFRHASAFDYKAVAAQLNQTLKSDAYQPRSFKTYAETWTWFQSISDRNPDNLELIELATTTDAAPLLRCLNQMPSPYSSEVAAELQSRVQKLKVKVRRKFLAYRLHIGNPKTKRDVLLYGKEHAEEFGTAEYLFSLTEFLLESIHEPTSLRPIDRLYREILSQVNLVFLPTLTPDQDTPHVYGKNSFGVLLQPYDFDSGNACDLARAPEAKAIRELADDLIRPILAVDYHSPFGVQSHTAQHASILMYTLGLIVEGLNARLCETGTSIASCDAIPERRNFETEVLISKTEDNSASFLSRKYAIPTLFTELTSTLDSMDPTVITNNPKDYFVEPNKDLTFDFIYLTRVLELTAMDLVGTLNN